MPNNPMRSMMRRLSNRTRVMRVRETRVAAIKKRYERSSICVSGSQVR